MRYLFGTVCVALALGTVGGATAQSSTPATVGTSYLIQDQDTTGPHPVLMFPYQATMWAGPAGWPVWYRVTPDKHTLQVALYVGPPRPDPDPLPAPGPDWSPATTWYLRTQDATTVLLVAAARGNVWDHAVTTLPATWDAASGILTVTLP